MEGTKKKTYPSSSKPEGGYSNTLSIALIIIAIVGFLITIGLNIFFVYIPVKRIESKIDGTAAKTDNTLSTVNGVAVNTEKVAKDVEDFINDIKRLIEEGREDICQLFPSLSICATTQQNNATTTASLLSDIRQGLNLNTNNRNNRNNGDICNGCRRH